MKVAFVSYEYPPDTADGGIATYVQQAGRMLSNCGHHVEVFAGSRERSGHADEDGVLIHRVQVDRAEQFGRRVSVPFADRHSKVRFDVLEGPDYGADADDASQLVPSVPLVVKLHTPRFLVKETNWRGVRPIQRARIRLAALRRGRWYSLHEPIYEREREHARRATEVVAPNLAIADIVGTRWRLDPSRLSHVPYPFSPAPDLLAIPLRRTMRVVGFIGRLERRKGVLDFARAIPRVLREHPRTRFLFVGGSSGAPPRGGTMQEYLESILHRHREAVEFTGAVSPSCVPAQLARMDICVFPSLWENSPLGCLEAMSAGRAVIASNTGGLPEMLDDGSCGRLVEAANPTAIATAIAELLQHPDDAVRLAEAARARVLTYYSPVRIAALQEASYRRAIDRKGSGIYQAAHT